MKKPTIISVVLVIAIIASILQYGLFPSQPVSEPHYNDYWSLNQPRLISEENLLTNNAIDVLFVGDTSFGENYHGRNFFENRQYDFFLEKLAPVLKQADSVIANLETPITNLLISPLDGKKKYIHWGDIHQTPKTLKKHNIHYVSLANNHTMDYGLGGLQQTIDALNEHQIQWFGAGLNVSQAAQPIYKRFVIGQNTFQLIVSAGFEHRSHYQTKYNYYATGDTSGVNRWKRQEVINQLRKIRRANTEAFIVAYPHWGKNYGFKTKRQTKLAHTLIDAGADLVIGHGAHIFQEIEKYRGHWILYNLGNFVFNSPGRYQKMEVAPFSLIAKLNVSHQKTGLTLTLILYPIFSDNRLSNYQPRPVTEKEINKVQDIIFQKSPPYLKQTMRVGKDQTGFFLTLDVWPSNTNTQNSR